MSPVSSSDSEDEQERLKLSEALDPDFIKVTGKQQKNGGTSEGNLINLNHHLYYYDSFFAL